MDSSDKNWFMGLFTSKTEASTDTEKPAEVPPLHRDKVYTSNVVFPVPKTIEEIDATVPPWVWSKEQDTLPTYVDRVKDQLDRLGFTYGKWDLAFGPVPVTVVRLAHTAMYLARMMDFTESAYRSIHPSHIELEKIILFMRRKYGNELYRYGHVEGVSDVVIRRLEQFKELEGSWWKRLVFLFTKRW